MKYGEYKIGVFVYALVNKFFHPGILLPRYLEFEFADLNKTWYGNCTRDLVKLLGNTHVYIHCLVRFQQHVIYNMYMFVSPKLPLFSGVKRNET